MSGENQQTMTAADVRELEIALAMAVGALKALETVYPQLTLVREMGERALYGAARERAEVPKT